MDSIKQKIITQLQLESQFLKNKLAEVEDACSGLNLETRYLILQPLTHQIYEIDHFLKFTLGTTLEQTNLPTKIERPDIQCDEVSCFKALAREHNMKWYERKQARLQESLKLTLVSKDN